MTTRIRIKSSTVPGKVPESSALDPAELAINLIDQKLYSRDANGTVFELSGRVYSVNGEVGDVVLEVDDLNDVDTTGINNGDLLAYDNGTYKPITPGNLDVTVDLGYTRAVDNGTITNTAGSDAVIPLADDVNAGLFTAAEKSKLAGVEEVFTAAEKSKLAGIEDGAQVNVPGEVPSGGTADRPASPNAGDLFYDIDVEALLYWNGTEWVEVGSGSSEVIVSPTPPAIDDLEEGTLWWNSDSTDLNLYILYQDADPDGGLKWIQAVAGGGSGGVTSIIAGDGISIDQSTGDVTITASGGSADGAVLLDDGGTKQVIKSGGLGISNGTTENITLAPDGTGYFLGNFNIGAGANWAGGTFNIRRPDNNWAQMISIDSTSDSPTGLFLGCGANSPGSQAILITKNHTGLGGTSTVNTVDIDWNGNAVFVGSVTVDGNRPVIAAGDNLVIDAGTADEINVRERLTKARETFQELQVAVANATDFGELKAAMLVALEDYAY